MPDNEELQKQLAEMQEQLRTEGPPDFDEMLAMQKRFDQFPLSVDDGRVLMSMCVLIDIATNNLAGIKQDEAMAPLVDIMEQTTKAIITGAVRAAYGLGLSAGSPLPGAFKDAGIQ